jgi:hypothetical protein
VWHGRCLVGTYGNHLRNKTPPATMASRLLGVHPRHAMYAYQPALKTSICYSAQPRPVPRQPKRRDASITSNEQSTAENIRILARWTELAKASLASGKLNPGRHQRLRAQACCLHGVQKQHHRLIRRHSMLRGSI